MNLGRIAVLHPCFWPEVRRGAERMLNDLMVGLVAAGQRPTLITSHPHRSQRTHERGYEILRLRRPPGRRFQIGLHGEYLTHVPGAYRALSGEEYSLAHVAYPSDAMAAEKWSRRTGTPYLFSAMGLPKEDAAARRLWFRLQSRAIARADVVTALSAAAAQRITSVFGRDDIRVIYPGVDLQRFSPGPGRAEKPTIFCPAAMEDPRKRVGLLLEAFAEMRLSHPDVELVLSAGPGKPAGAVQPGVRVLDLSNDESVVDAYRKAWVTVLPSLEEAFGLVLVESLACGTPVVAANDGAPPEVIGDTSVGCLFDGGDPEALASALLQAVILSSEPGVSDQCRTRAEQFSTRRMTDSFRELYVELLTTC